MLVEGCMAGKLSQMLKSSKHAPEMTKEMKAEAAVAWWPGKGQEPGSWREERTCDLSTEHCRGGGARGRWRRAPR